MVHQHLPGLDPGAEQDAVEEICLQVLADLDKPHDPKAFQGVVCGQFLSVRRRMLARARTGGSDVPTEGVGVPSRLDEDPGELALALLAQCLGTLPRRDRRALELCFFQQASPAEIAVAMGVPEGDVRPIVFNSLALLRRCMRARAGREAVRVASPMMHKELDLDYQESNPTREQWLRLHAAVQPVDDPHPVQGWELGEYVALMKMLWEENYAKMTLYTHMYIICSLQSSRRSVFHHIEGGCSNCLEDVHSFMTLLGPPNGAAVRIVRACMNCQKDSPYAALFCVWCGDRIRDQHLPFSMRRETRLA